MTKDVPNREVEMDKSPKPLQVVVRRKTMQARSATATTRAMPSVIETDEVVMTSRFKSNVVSSTVVTSKVVDVIQPQVKPKQKPQIVVHDASGETTEQVADESDEEEGADQEELLSEKLIPGLHLFAQTGEIKYLLLAVRRLIDSTHEDGDKFDNHHNI